MNNMTTEKMSELAEIVTGEKHYHDSYCVIQITGYLDDDSPVLGQEWNPSLTGEPWQKEQALEVIVAAWKQCSKCKLDSIYTGNVVRGFVVPQGEITDLLTAASLALISGGRA